MASSAGLRQRSAATSSFPTTASSLDAGVRVVKVVDESESSSASEEEDESLPGFTPPTFTIKELRDAVPARCFERSALKSGAYIVGDVAMLAVIAYTATYINSVFGWNGLLLDGFAGRVAQFVAWAAYAYIAGLPATGLWVIAHECGHQGFSESKTINNTVGWALHSALLVPYHSWRISHAQHHAATGHMTRDQVFVPKTRSQLKLGTRLQQLTRRVGTAYEKADDLLDDAPIWVILNVLLQQTFGWPLYLILNASGQKYGRRTNHFEPSSPIFDVRHFRDIVVSDLGLALSFSALGYWGYQRGFTEVFAYYLAPYLWVNSNLVMITYLQHTAEHTPHYREPSWNFARGALCTVDRKYFGFFLHGICETHVAHHLFSQMPHYNAWEATEALKEKLGDHYMYDDTNMFVALYKSYKSCRFVEDEGDVLFYKNAQGKAARRVVYDAPPSDSAVEADDAK